MRTTIEFPSALIRAAKARSAEQGESLKKLLARALAVELARGSPIPSVRPRLVLPLFGSAQGDRVNPSNMDLERALAEADGHHVSKPSVRRSKR